MTHAHIPCPFNRPECSMAVEVPVPDVRMYTEQLADAIARRLEVSIRDMVRREIALCLGEQKP